MEKFNRHYVVGYVKEIIDSVISAVRGNNRFNVESLLEFRVDNFREFDFTELVFCEMLT